MSRRYFNDDHDDREDRRGGWFDWLPDAFEGVFDFLAEGGVELLAGAVRFIGHAVMIVIRGLFHFLD